MCRNVLAISGLLELERSVRSSHAAVYSVFYRPMRTNRSNTMEHAACGLLRGSLGSSPWKYYSPHGIMGANLLNVTHMIWAHAAVS